MKKKLIILCLISLTSLPFACSEDNNSIIENSLENKYDTPDFHNKSLELLTSKIKSDFTKSNSVHLTQEQLDNYLQIIGYNGEVTSLNDINNIIDKTIDMANGTLTYEEVVEQSNISSITKNIANEIPYSSIGDLNSIEGFSNIPFSEQELLTYLNNLKQAKENGLIIFGDGQKAGCFANGSPINCWEGGALGGGMIGFGCCGPGGAIIGAVIGAVVFSVIGK